MKLYFTIIIILILSSCNQQEDDLKVDINNTKDVEISKNKTDGINVINELNDVGFFNITDTIMLEKVKQEMILSYEKYNYFGSLTKEESLEYFDNRFFSVDQEELFELGGLTKNLEKVKKTFNLLGLKLNYSNENNNEASFNSESNHWKHTIELNNKEYIAFDGEMDENSWATATINFTNMLNDQLALQGSEEQVYIIYSGNDGMLVFLTPEMFKIVEKYYPDDYNRPMSSEKWKEYNKI